MPAQVSAVVQHESRSLAPATEDDIKLISSMKVLTKGRETLPEYMKHGAFDNIAYSMMTLIPAKKRMTDKLQPPKIPLKRWCQLLGQRMKKIYCKFQNSMLLSRIFSVCGHHTFPMQRK